METMSNQGVQRAGSLMEELSELFKSPAKNDEWGTGYFCGIGDAVRLAACHEAASQAERDRLQARITELEHQADERNAGYDVLFRSCEQHRDRADRREGSLVAERVAIANLRAEITTAKTEMRNKAKRRLKRLNDGSDDWRNGYSGGMNDACDRLTALLAASEPKP